MLIPSTVFSPLSSLLQLWEEQISSSAFAYCRNCSSTWHKHNWENHYNPRCKLCLEPRPSRPSICHLQYWCGEGLLRLITCIDVPRHQMDMWRGGTFPEHNRYGCTSQTTEWLTGQYWASLAMFLGFRKLSHSYAEEMCHFLHMSNRQWKKWCSKFWNVV